MNKKVTAFAMTGSAIAFFVVLLRKLVNKRDNPFLLSEESKKVYYIEKYSGKEELVSVIMPAYNCERFIAESIHSVQAQTYSLWELLIVDDCSTDKTPDIIKELESKDGRIHYLKTENNSGAAAARNKAVEVAEGRYMAFLDSDDVWRPEKLERQIQFMRNNGYLFSCTSYDKIDENGVSLNHVVDALTIDYKGMLRRCPGNSTVMYDANILGKYTIPLIKKRNDYVMWLEVIKDAHMLQGLNEVLGSHRIVTDSISSNKFSLVKYHWIVYKDIEKVGVIESAYLVMFWIAKAVFKFR